MAEQKRATESQHEKLRPQELEREAAALEGARQAAFAGSDGGPLGPPEDISIQAVAARLGDTRFQTAQRQAMASRIGRVSGNRYLQRAVVEARQHEGLGRATPSRYQAVHDGTRVSRRLAQPAARIRDAQAHRRPRDEGEVAQSGLERNRASPFQSQAQREQEHPHTERTSDHISRLTPDLQSRVQSVEGAGHALNARPYTVGGDKVLRAGPHVPEMRAGERLQAHEWTYVTQNAVSGGDDRAQEEPSRSASASSIGKGPFLPSKTGLVSRQPAKGGVANKSAKVEAYEYMFLRVFGVKPTGYIGKAFEAKMKKVPFFGKSIGRGVHPLLAAKLRVADNRLSTKYPRQYQEWAKPVTQGGSKITSSYRPLAAFHGVGLAVDIDGGDNPYIFPHWSTARAIKNATKLFHGTEVNIFKPFRTATRAWGVLSRANEALKKYARLIVAFRQHWWILAQAIHARARNYALPPLVKKQISESKAVKLFEQASQTIPGLKNRPLLWLATMERDDANLRKEGGWKLDLTKYGFMRLDFPIIKVLTDLRMTWGGMEVWAGGKDLMHFDWRKAGSGTPLTLKQRKDCHKTAAKAVRAQARAAPPAAAGAAAD